jgi:hypothetical protein
MAFKKERKKDIIIVASILGLALLLFLATRIFFNDSGETYCEILVDGNVVAEVELFENRTFSIEERPAIVFEVKDRAIAFIHSDCPDKVCIHSGFQSHNGQSASCLPNQTSIVIRSRNREADDPEIVVGFGGGNER